MRMTKTKAVILLILLTCFITIVGMQIASIRHNTIRVYNLDGVYYECEFDSNNNMLSCREVPRP